MSESTRRLVGLPSRSRISPALVDGSAMVRGWTYSWWTSANACSRRSSPIGSLRTVVAGPTTTTPRASAGMSSGCVTVCPGRRSGTPNSTRPWPTGRSIRPGSAVRRPWLRTTIAPSTPLPATTRSCASERSTSYERAPEQERDARDQEHERDRPGDHPLDPPEHEARAPRPTVAARATSAPAGRTVRALQSEAARQRHPRGAPDPGPPHDAPARSPCAAACGGDRRRGDLREPVGSACAAEVRVRRDSVTLIRPRVDSVAATSSSTWPMTASCVTPSNSASGSRIRRCESTAWRAT